jgi:hypothetical protein
MSEKQNWRPHFDADVMSAANVEPTIAIGHFTYVGRLFSAPEWFQWNERLQMLKASIEAGTAKSVDLLLFYHTFFRAIFRPGLFRRGVPFWAPDVADALLQEPLTTIQEAFERFFERQARANGASTKSPSTNGPNSNDATQVAAEPVGA